MNRPSVLWVNQFALLPRDGGGTRHFELGRELVRRGWHVSVMASDLHLHRRTYTRRSSPRDRSVIAEDCQGVSFQWLWTSAYQKNNWRRLWNWLSFARSVKRAGRKCESPSVVIGSSPQLFAALAAHSVAKRLKVPFVFEVRDLWPESLVAAGGGRGVAYRVLDGIARRLYADADRILVLTGGVRDYLVRRGIPATKIAIVPNGVDVHAVTPGGSDGLAAGAANRPIVCVYAGAHGAANGLDGVLDAAALLTAAKARFVLIGDGPEKKSLVAAAARRGLASVEFRDAVSKDALVGVLRQADAGLMVLREAPLFSFGVSPNKLYDYMACGLPVVCNVPGEVAEIVAQAECGVQAQDSSGTALATAIARIADMSPEARRMLGSAGREWVQKRHSREVLGEQLDSFLRQLID